MTKDTTCKRWTRRGFKIASDAINLTGICLGILLLLAIILTITVMPGYWILHAKSNIDIFDGSLFYGIFCVAALMIVLGNYPVTSRRRQEAMEAKELKRILAAHQKWLEDAAQGTRANLSGANLDGATLSRANLSGATLSGANLSRANLYGANLSRANLSGANLSGTNLYGANLSGANLSGANLSRANLSGANLYGANLYGANLYGANLSGANLYGATLDGATLDGATLGNTILDGIDWLAWLGVSPDGQGRARAYKLTNKQRQGCYKGGILYTVGHEVEAALNTEANLACAQGVNLATFRWALDHVRDAGEGARLFLCEFEVTPENVCVPIGSDGKFRVAKATVIAECDMKGKVIPDETIREVKG